MTLFSLSSRFVFVFAFATAGIVLACSSGTTGTGTADGGSTSTTTSGAQAGGQAKIKTCKNTKLNHPTTAVDDACNSCSATKCEAESTAALGSDPNAFGGACAELVQCECDCEATDTSCLLPCLGKETPACKSALDAAVNCTHTTCAPECGAAADAGTTATDGG